MVPTILHYPTNSRHLARAFRANRLCNPAPSRLIPGKRFLLSARMPATIRTDIPARLDALPWSRWHTKIVIALGITWVLDGLEVTLAGAVGAALKDPRALHLTDSQVGFSATFYLLGAVIGALVFGYLTDLHGRKKLFFITLAVYVAATAATAFSWNPSSYFLFRAITGAGIGGEYAAINSAIDELIPARLRGQVDLTINATFWIGAALGSGATIFLLDPALVPVSYGWRFAFGIGALLGCGILFLRRAVPESPRWLVIHGHEHEAEAILSGITVRAEASAIGDAHPDKEPCGLTVIHPRQRTPLSEIARTMFVDHRRRSILGLVLMAAQAFFYNAIFFTYALVLSRFYNVPAGRVSAYIFPFAAGNVLGPVLLGRLFDSIGRKPMIVTTYALSGILLAATGLLFAHGLLTATTQSIAWTIIFFTASCAASSAYLTVSEVFPLETRALAISVFYAAGTLIGGVAAPSFFGYLIGTGSRTNLLWGYLAGAALMIIAAMTEAILGVKAERQSLESIAAPLSSRPE
jgi:MFS family permease